MENPKTIRSTPERLFGAVPPPIIIGNAAPPDSGGSNPINWTLIIIGLVILIGVGIIFYNKTQAMVMKTTDDIKAEIPKQIAEAISKTKILSPIPDPAEAENTFIPVKKETVNTPNNRSQKLL